MLRRALQQARKMKRKYLIFLILGLLLIALTVWQIATAQKGLEVIKLPDANPPVTIIAPADTAPASRPTVLIAHGFAGSSVLMRGFALTLAQAGYTTVSWDFKGHGENPTPLSLSNESSGLLKDAEAALAQAAAADWAGIAPKTRRPANPPSRRRIAGGCRAESQQANCARIGRVHLAPGRRSVANQAGPPAPAASRSGRPRSD
jgi:pimeloyl-ACP methyl ester carboxylesterase